MLVKEIIDLLKSDCVYVNKAITSDHVLCGEIDKEVDKIGVCWIATMDVLYQAKKEDIHFIISHENFLYVESTHSYQGILDSRKKKLDFCKENDITVYRCHDFWDKYPVYGVADTLADKLNLPFEERKITSFYHYANINETLTVKQIAKRYANVLKDYGADYVEVFGNPNQKVKRLGMGIGAVASSDEMHINGADCMVLADDAYTNWINLQWCKDNDIACILYHHATNEIPGMENMVNWFKVTLPNIKAIKLNENFIFEAIHAD